MLQSTKFLKAFSTLLRKLLFCLKSNKSEFMLVCNQFSLPFNNKHRKWHHCRGSHPCWEQHLAMIHHIHQNERKKKINQRWDQGNVISWSLGLERVWLWGWECRLVCHSISGWKIQPLLDCHYLLNIHGPKMRNPSVFGDPMAFPLTPPWGWHFFTEMSQHWNDMKYSADNCSAQRWNLIFVISLLFKQPTSCCCFI